VRGIGGVPIEINGVEDHVHLLVKIKPVIAVSDFLRELKATSSGWSKKKTKGRFAWQARYGAFTVSESQVDRVRLYIQNQEEHHRKFSFEEQFKALLRAHRVVFDEAHLWN
jgi:REP element-mobilizing transposase RayT